MFKTWTPVFAKLTILVAGMTILFFISIVRADITTGLVGHWTFDEGSGSTTADSTGSGATGVLVSTPTWSAGRFGNALTFDGNSQYVSITTNSWVPVYRPNSPYSVSFWMKATGGTPYYEGWSAALIFTNNGQSITTWIYNNGQFLLSKTSQSKVYDGTWHHIVWTDNAGAGILYIDGTKDATDFTYSSQGTAIPNVCLIGTEGSQYGNFSFLDGSMDEVRAYNRVLSASDVLELYNQSGARPPQILTSFPSGSLPSYMNGATLFLESDEYATCRYSVTAGVSYDLMVGTFASVDNRKQEAVVGGLSSGSSYTYYAKCRDWAGNTSSDYPIIFSIQAVGGNSDLIPSDRLVTWTAGATVGVPGGIPTNRSHLIDVTQAPNNVDNTGGSDVSAELQTVINAAQANDVVYLPQGVYRIDNGLSISHGNSNITFRGAGMDRTVLDCRAPSGCMGIGGGSYSPIANAAITGGLTKGSTLLNVAGASAFSVGRIAQIILENDPTLPVVSVFDYPELRGQQVMVTGHTATTVSISPAVFGDFHNLSARLVVLQDQTNFVGLEDLTVDSSIGQGTIGLSMVQAYGCWVKDVKIRHVSNYFLSVSGSLECEFRHCYLDEALSNGSNHAGILMGGVSGSLIEDNIIYKVFPHMEINGGCAGNVFAYNFTDKNFSLGDGTYMGAYIDSNHNPHNAYNLYEGNIAGIFETDGYFGGESEETLFRNWFYGTDDAINVFVRCIQLNRFARNFSIVGNVLGRTADKNGTPLAYVYDNRYGLTKWDGAGGPRLIYMLGLPNIGNGSYNGNYAQLSQGNPWPDWASVITSPWGAGPGPGCCQELDLDVPATTVIKDNWNSADNGINSSEVLSGQVLPTSLYLAAKPSWFGNLTWPAFNPQSPNQNYDAIPAGYRFVHGVEPPEAPTTETTSLPIIIGQPQNKSVAVGGTAVFAVFAYAYPTATYQWKENGIDISSATISSYVTPPATTGDNGSRFSVVITNSQGSVTSAEAILTVGENSVNPPVVTSTSTINFLPFKNVFNPLKDLSMTIQYQNPSNLAVDLKIFDRKGNKIISLEAGLQSATWDGRNDQGSVVASGTYILVLKAGDVKLTKKIVVVK